RRGAGRSGERARAGSEGGRRHLRLSGEEPAAAARGDSVLPRLARDAQRHGAPAAQGRSRLHGGGGAARAGGGAARVLAAILLAGRGGQRARGAGERRRAGECTAVVFTRAAAGAKRSTRQVGNILT